jgi:hypothetical protein
MKTKCYSVRLESLVSISDKAFRATDFNGNSDIIPASQVIAMDWDVSKSEAYWISAWILEKKSITYSTKKEAWFNENGDMLPTYTVEHHKPERRKPINNEIKELQK